MLIIQHFTLVSGRTLTPSIAFTSIAVFAELRYALNALPETFIQALQGEWSTGTRRAILTSILRLCVVSSYREIHVSC